MLSSRPGDLNFKATICAVFSPILSFKFRVFLHQQVLNLSLLGEYHRIHWQSNEIYEPSLQAKTDILTITVITFIDPLMPSWEGPSEPSFFSFYSHKMNTTAKQNQIRNKTSYAYSQSMVLLFLHFPPNMHKKLVVSRIFLQTCQPMQGLAFPKSFLKVHTTHFYDILVKTFSLYKFF